MPIKNLKQAQKALENVRGLKSLIEDLKAEHGIDQFEADMAALKADVTAWAVQTETETIPLAGGHAQLRRDKYGGTWVTTRSDLLEAPEGKFSLWDVLRHKFGDHPGKRMEIWKRITKRVVNPEALSEAVEEGILSVEDVERCYYEKEKSPYLRIYEDEG